MSPLVVLRANVPHEGEIEQYFTYNERELAVHIGKEWQKRGWKPRLLCKSYDGQFVWLTSLLSSQKLAA
jgi:hypothetical protein